MVSPALLMKQLQVSSTQSLAKDIHLSDAFADLAMDLLMGPSFEIEPYDDYDDWNLELDETVQDNTKANDDVDLDLDLQQGDVAPLVDVAKQALESLELSLSDTINLVEDLETKSKKIPYIAPTILLSGVAQRKALPKFPLKANKNATANHVSQKNGGLLTVPDRPETPLTSESDDEI